MLRILTFFLAACGVLAAASADVVIYGCTSGAITAAIQTKKSGKSVMMVCPEKHLGGLTAGGLGWTDSGNKAVIGGLSREFYHRVWQKYQKDEAWKWQKREQYGNKGQGTEAIDGTNRTMWIFEPHVAEQVYEEWVKELKIPIVRNAWLDRAKGVKMNKGRIESIRTLDGKTYQGKMFIDATYEGDLMASAGVDYHVGRESMATYNEKWAGIQTGVLHHRHHFGAVPQPISPYVKPGDPSSGVLPRISAEPPGRYGDGDNKVQAYCFRMCLTKHEANRVPFPKPAKYDAREYELLLRVFQAGWRETFHKFDPIPNFKTDTNNHGPFSTDNIGRNYDYPDASYERRKEIIDEHVNYQQGLLYFIANDPRVPADVRNEFAKWGLAKDEFTDNGNWPHQMYVREARRMIGRYVMTENELVKRRPTPESVGMGSYGIDSHNIQRYITPEGYVQNEGDIGVSTNGPYQISYGALVPKKGQAANLLVPVCLSSSHIAYGSIRMEPVFMILGQSAATAAAMAIDGKLDVQDVPYDKLRAKLEADGQVLAYTPPKPTHARKVEIIRDKWGIAHVYGETDADTVFGAIYAQAEDDFNRVETNYLKAMGRMAEAEGASRLVEDLRMRLFIDPAELQRLYGKSPEWLKKLMDAWAEGLNYYLATHPNVKPRVITRFEPWMALSFTEGSIGGDIEQIKLAGLGEFYDRKASILAQAEIDREPRGSNGVAIGPANTKNKAALLLINPHTSFYFRSELQMVSKEGLNAYGASTWGQFFIYQGFNDKAGWMHTSSGVDVIDEYAETVTQQGEKFFYKYGSEERPLITKTIVLPYKTAKGTAEKSYTAYFTHHGPVVRQEGGKWISVRLMNNPVEALQQSYLRTKATDYKSFRQTMELKTNSSNNTIFADASGNIAYFHGNFLPRRDTRYDFTKPVDGADPGTEWGALHTIDETPNLLNPRAGWLYNANDYPWWAAGKGSLDAAKYPAYVESGTASARGVHALKVLEGKTDFTVESLLAAAYDSYLPWFEKPLPALLAAKPEHEAVKLLEKWDMRWAKDSVATSLAVFWGNEARTAAAAEARKAGMLVENYLGTKASPELLKQAFDRAIARLERDFGTWRTPWGEINRFQRLTGDIEHPFDDKKMSIPVGFTSAVWGSLASFGAQPRRGTKKWYGTSGNSFVAVVEFGPKVRAIAISAGGESGDPSSPHFSDQAERYADGKLREVWFYPEQVKANQERVYKP